jgi:hypothetical protein
MRNMNNTNIYSTMLGNFMAQLRKIVETNKRYILSNPQFEEGLNGFNMGVAQILQIVNNPAILLYDTDQKKHLIVGGEKWKLFSAILRENYEIVTTDPFLVRVEKYTTNKELVIEALNSHEKTYNNLIEKTMLVNEHMNTIQHATSNTDKVTEMNLICDLVQSSIDELTVIFGPSVTIKLPN